MRHIALFACAALLSTPALAGRLAQVSIVDRDSGQVLPTHFHNGEYWVAGRPGAHYAIRIRSTYGSRLEAVTSVDGVNVVSGETAAVDQTGYVYSPWQAYDIAGWRKSNSEIAAFTFTSIPKSYAARTGRPDNVGVIGVAVFRERENPVKLEVAPAAPRVYGPREPPPPGPPAPPAFGPPAPPAAASQPGAGGGARGGAPRAGGPANDVAQERAPSLGTGHGRREVSVVTLVNFERAQLQPDELIRIRYDSQENLVAMGVIPPAPPRPRQVDPFPEPPKMRYVPDP